MVRPIGLVVALVGVAVAYWARQIAWVDEAGDAIGSRRGVHGAEPAPWKVGLTRYGGYVLVGAGVLLFFGDAVWAFVEWLP